MPNLDYLSYTSQNSTLKARFGRFTHTIKGGDSYPAQSVTPIHEVDFENENIDFLAANGLFRAEVIQGGYGGDHWYYITSQQGNQLAGKSGGSSFQLPIVIEISNNKVVFGLENPFAFSQTNDAGYSNRVDVEYFIYYD